MKLQVAATVPAVRTGFDAGALRGLAERLVTAALRTAYQDWDLDELSITFMWEKN